MANDIHVWLSDDEAAQIKALAEREDRSVTNTARVLIRRGLAAEPDLSREDRVKRGRPPTKPTAPLAAPPGSLLKHKPAKP